MNKDIILGLIRHLLTFAGGAIAAKGLASNDEITDLIGGIVTVVGVLWSIVHKYQAAKANPPAAGPGTLPSLLFILAMVPLLLTVGCVSATATRTSTDGTQDSVKVSSFLNSIKNGTYTNGSGTTLSVTDSTPDQQSIALLAGGVIELSKLAIFATRAPTNTAAAATIDTTQ